MVCYPAGDQLPMTLPGDRVKCRLINWRSAMRSLWILCLLVVLGASESASAKEHRAKSRDAIVRTAPAVIPGSVTPGGSRIYRDNSVPGGFRTDHDAPPAYNDPSKRGSA